MAWVDITPKSVEARVIYRPGICRIRKNAKDGHSYEAYFNREEALARGLLPRSYFRLYVDVENRKIGIQILGNDKPAGIAFRILDSGQIRCCVTQAVRLLGISEGFYRWDAESGTGFIVIDVREPVDQAEAFMLRSRG